MAKILAQLGMVHEAIQRLRGLFCSFDLLNFRLRKNFAQIDQFLAKQMTMLDYDLLPEVLTKGDQCLAYRTFRFSK